MIRFGKTGIPAGLQNFAFFQASKDETEAGEGRESRDTLEGTHAWRFSLLALKKAKK